MLHKSQNAWHVSELKNKEEVKSHDNYYTNNKFYFFLKIIVTDNSEHRLIQQKTYFSKYLSNQLFYQKIGGTSKHRYAM